MSRVTHLNKNNGTGWASKTACGRGLLRTPISMDWKDYKNEPVEYRCAKCEASRQVALNLKMDSKKLT